MHLSAPAIKPRKLRMILNTFISGPQAWFFLADDRGYLRDEGIELEFVEGDTAANAVPRVASGEFDVGYGDINALIELAASAEPCGALAVFAPFTASPYTIAVPAAGTVRQPSQIAGLTLAAHPNDAAMRMLPELALGAGFDAASVKLDITTLPHPEMLVRMLSHGAWDGMFGFVNTLRAAAIEAKIDPANLRFLEYRDHLPDLYGSVVLVTRKLAETAPELVAGLVRAINRALADVIVDTGAAIDAVAKKNPRIDHAANLARLEGTLALEMAGAADGVGDLDDDRLVRAIALIVKAKGHPRTPAPGEIFSRRFLPPQAIRARTARLPGAT